VIPNRNQYLIPSFISIGIYHGGMPLSESPSAIVAVALLSESTSKSTIIACYYRNRHLLLLQSLIGINIGIYHHCMLLLLYVIIGRLASTSASTIIACYYRNRHLPPLQSPTGINIASTIIICYYRNRHQPSASTIVAVPYRNQH
jgi:hypothetical protein